MINPGTDHVFDFGRLSYGTRLIPGAQRTRVLLMADPGQIAYYY